MKTLKIILSLIMIFILLTCNYSCKNSNSIVDKKIIVTAPRNYNTRLSKLINDTGAKAIPMPVVDIHLLEDKSHIDSILNNIAKYKWIVLPSRNAIKAFFTRAKDINICNKKLNITTYCAIGKDIEYLKTFSVDSILYPQDPSPRGILESILEKNITNSNIAVFAPLVVGLPEPNVVPNFIKNLNDAGLKVKRINAYVTQLNISNSFKKEIEDINNGEIDLIAFTSTAEIEAMIHIVGGIDNLRKTRIACFGPYTAGNAKRLGLKPCFISKDYSSFKGYVDSMRNFFKK